MFYFFFLSFFFFHFNSVSFYVIATYKKNSPHFIQTCFLPYFLVLVYVFITFVFGYCSFVGVFFFVFRFFCFSFFFFFFFFFLTTGNSHQSSAHAHSSIYVPTFQMTLTCFVCTVVCSARRLSHVKILHLRR